MGNLYDLNFKSETLKNSRGYNGSGVATYPNADTYDGQFKDGVFYIYLILFS